MTAWALAWQGLRQSPRGALAAVGATAVAAAVLTGSLMLGSDLEATLDARVIRRLGKVDGLIEGGGRLIDARLARELSDSVVTASPILRLRGMAWQDEGGSDAARVGRVKVWGVDKGFAEFSPGAQDWSQTLVRGNAVGINDELASRLGVEVGDVIQLRVERPGAGGREAPLSDQRASTTARLRCRVAVILGAEQLGDFDESVDVQAPRNVFVDIAWLRARVLENPWTDVACDGFVLYVAVDGDGEKIPAMRLSRMSAPIPQRLGYVLKTGGRDAAPALQGPQIYFDPGMALRAQWVSGAGPTLYYLVNGMSAAGGGLSASTPYSFVAGVTPGATGPVPADMRDDELLLNAWTAEALGVSTGATVQLSYSVVTGPREFAPTSRWFTVRGVLPMASLAAEREAVPEFPGLSDVDRCADWDIGMPLDDEQLEDEANEAYWEAFGPTPKAFVTYAAARGMWSNVYGQVMTVRFPAGTETNEVWDALAAARVDSGTLGLHVRQLRDTAERAVGQSMDFSQLFLSMSFFLVASALMLVAFAYGLSAEHRATQFGLLRATGWGRRAVLGVGIREALLVGGVGAVLGVVLASGCARLWTWGLNGVWGGALGGTTIERAARGVWLGDAVIGGLVTWGLGMASMALRLHRLLKRPPLDLLRHGALPGGTASDRAWSRRGCVARWSVLVAVLGAVAWGQSADNPAPGFFLGGTLTLVWAGMMLHGVLVRLAGRSWPGLTERVWVARSLALRPGRTLLVVLLLAGGSFMVVGVFAWKQDVAYGAERSDSGTGGFELYVETSLPVDGDPGREKGLERLGWSPDAVAAAATIVPCKLLDGDDAGCLNLSRAQAPRLLGVEVERMAELGAFGEGAIEAWTRLLTPRADGAVPALVGDADTLTWGLAPPSLAADGVPLLQYVNERGEPFDVALVGTLPQRSTIFKGMVLLAMGDFVAQYPGESGFRALLVDADDPAAASAQLTERLARHGATIQTTVERLQMFYQVEATYLGMFLVLGGLGVLLGTAGLGFVAARNLYERRSELALLRAVGFGRGQIRRLIGREYRIMTGLGILFGVIASFIAVAPAMARPGMRVPWFSLLGLLGALFATGLLAVAVGVRAALHGTTHESLRSE